MTHATERYTDAKRRVRAALWATALPHGAAWVDERDPSHDPEVVRAFARMSWRPIGETPRRRFDATHHAFEVRVLVVIDCVAPLGDDAEDVAVDAVDEIADEVASALRLLSVGWTDYTTDPENPSSVTGSPIRAIDPPSLLVRPAVDGYALTQVTAELRWMARRAA